MTLSFQEALPVVRNSIKTHWQLDNDSGITVKDEKISSRSQYLLSDITMAKCSLAYEQGLRMPTIDLWFFESSLPHRLKRAS